MNVYNLYCRTSSLYGSPGNEYIYMIFGMSNSTINLSILLMNDDILWPAEHRRMWLSFFYSSSPSNETLFLSYFREIKMQEIHQENFLHEFSLD